MEKLQPELYIIMPAYNEEENIETVVAQWHPIVQKIGKGSRLVVIDDGSRDSTYKCLIRLQEKYPMLTALTKQNQGHGPTVRYGYQYACEQKARYVFQTDSDGQTLPEEFWPLWKEREKCGLLMGCRRSRQDGLSRKLVTRVLKLVVLATFNVRLEDANVPFRLMQARQLEQVLLSIPEEFNLANVLLAVIYKKRKLGVYSYPITFRPRQGGTNSINMKRIVQIGRGAVRDFWHFRKNIR